MVMSLTEDERSDAYDLRFADIGEFDFDDTYVGYHDSVSAFVCDTFVDGSSIPDCLLAYLDVDELIRDTMGGYTAYDGSDGVHIFRNG